MDNKILQKTLRQPTLTELFANQVWEANHLREIEPSTSSTQMPETTNYLRDIEPSTSSTQMPETTQIIEPSTSFTQNVLKRPVTDLSEIEQPIENVQKKQRKTNDLSKIKSLKRKQHVNIDAIAEVIDLTKDEDEVIDLTKDDNEPVQEERNCDIKPKERNCDIDPIKIHEDSEYSKNSVNPTESQQDEEIPLYTIKNSESLLSESHTLENERLGTLKVLPMKIIDIHERTALINKNPLLYQYDTHKFSIVQIRGTIFAIERTITSKTVLTVNDGTASIKVFVDDAKKGKNQTRTKLEEFVNKTSKMELATKDKLIEWGNMPEQTYFKQVAQDTFLNTVSNIVAKKLETKLQLQFPDVFTTGTQINITGRLLIRTNYLYEAGGDYLVYSHNMKKIL